jgi:hypothetical protein
MWTMPLVEPMANGRWVTPVWLDGQGPFLFVVDPTQDLTTVDARLIGRLELGSFHALVLSSLRAGDYEVRELPVDRDDEPLAPFGKHDVWGVIGRNALGDGFVTFDRDRGTWTIRARAGFEPPAETYELAPGHDLADFAVRLGDQPEHAAVTLGAPVTWVNNAEFRRAHLDRELATLAIPSAVVDGTLRPRAAIALAAQDVACVTDDSAETGVQLGLDAFRGYVVTADPGRRRLYLTPRRPSVEAAAARTSRWHAAIPASCAATGCVSLAVVGNASQTIAHVVRDPRAHGMPLEISYRAIDADGNDLPNLYVSLPDDVDYVNAVIAANYARSTLIVLDVSPFTVWCSHGCVMQDAGEDSW